MIAIIAAMDKELNTLLDALTVASIEVLADKTFYVGTLNGKEVVIAKSGIGKVNAAVTTAILLQRYDIDYLINTGVAGGVLPSQSQDIVIAKTLAYSDVDVTRISPNLPYGQMEGEPLSVASDPALVRQAEAILKASNTNFRVGALVSGDQFITSIDQLRPIMNVVPNVIACEMEAMAVALTAYHFSVPFLVMRGISDVLDEPSQVSDYHQIAAQIAAKTTAFVMRLVGEYSCKRL